MRANIKLLLLLFLPTTIALILFIVRAKAQRNADDHNVSEVQQEIYARGLLAPWNRQPYIALKAGGFRAELHNFIAPLAVEPRCNALMAQKLEQSVALLLDAYSVGTFEAYKDFKFPLGVPYTIKTNRYGSIEAFLRNGPFFGSAEIANRHEEKYQKRSLGYLNAPFLEKLRFYVDSYSNGTFYSNYWTEVAFPASLLKVSVYSEEIVPIWKVEFQPKKHYPGFSADATFPNLGYSSQKANTYIRYKPDIKEVMLSEGSVIVADLLVYVRGVELRRTMPVLLRFYWVAAYDKWLPDDICITNLKYIMDVFPVF